MDTRPTPSDPAGVKVSVLVLPARKTESTPADRISMAAHAAMPDAPRPTAAELALIAATLANARPDLDESILPAKALELWEGCNTVLCYARENAKEDAELKKIRTAIFQEWPFGHLAEAAEPRALADIVHRLDNRAADEGAPTAPLDKFLAELMPKKREADRPALYERFWTALGLDGAEQTTRDKESGVPAWRTRGFDEAFQDWQEAEISAARREAGSKGGQSTAKRAAKRASAAKRAGQRAGR